MKADELRAAADGLSNEVARDTMLEMADGYDRLAANMEQFGVSGRAGKPRR